jgi:hypothetical protein
VEITTQRCSIEAVIGRHDAVGERGNPVRTVTEAEIMGDHEHREPQRCAVLTASKSPLRSVEA